MFVQTRCVMASGLDYAITNVMCNVTMTVNATCVSNIYLTILQIEHELVIYEGFLQSNYTKCHTNCNCEYELKLESYILCKHCHILVTVTCI